MAMQMTLVEEAAGDRRFCHGMPARQQFPGLRQTQVQEQGVRRKTCLAHAETAERPLVQRAGPRQIGERHVLRKALPEDLHDPGDRQRRPARSEFPDFTMLPQRGHDLPEQGLLLQDFIPAQGLGEIVEQVIRARSRAETPTRRYSMLREASTTRRTRR